MKTFAVIALTAALLAGCASLEETYFVDREFGQATQASFDKQVAYPDYRFAGKTPETLPGIIGEDIMSVHEQTFQETPEKIQLPELGMGGQ